MIRSAIKRGIKKALGMEEKGVPPPPPAPSWTAKPEVSEAAAPPAPAVVEPEKPAQKAWIPPSDEPIPGKPLPVDKGGIAVTTAAPPESPAVAPKMDPQDDTAGKPLSMEAVQEIMDEMVRPALQGDGGDITLIKVENNDIYVRLVGSCSTCPSSIMTMKMGVEALLKEEFPSMGSLIQVEQAPVEH